MLRKNVFIILKTINPIILINIYAQIFNTHIELDNLSSILLNQSWYIILAFIEDKYK